MAMISVPVKGGLRGGVMRSLTLDDLPEIPKTKVIGLVDILHEHDNSISSLNNKVDAIKVEPLPQDLGRTDNPEFSTLRLNNLNTGSGTSVVRNSNGELVELTSSLEHKENVTRARDTFDPKILFQLESKYYNYKNHPEVKCVGYLAEDLQHIAPDLVTLKNGQPYSILYSNLTPIIVDLVKDQDDRIKLLYSQVAAIQRRLGQQSPGEGIAAVVPENEPKKPEVTTDKNLSGIKTVLAIIITALMGTLAIAAKAFGIYTSK